MADRTPPSPLALATLSLLEVGPLHPYGLQRAGLVAARVTLIESEHQRAVVAAELEWMDAVAVDLRSGALTWSHEELAGLANADLG